jgi:hypothetical protein
MARTLAANAAARREITEYCMLKVFRMDLVSILEAL